MTASSSAEAIECFSSWRPNVLLCDIAMPGEDGYSLMSQIRARTDGTLVPAIALTAYAREQDRRRALASGYQMHLPKPVEPAHLIDAVLAACARRVVT